MTTALPSLTRFRRDGWTPAVQRLFLDELALTGSPSRAATAAGRSLQSAYKLRARPEATAFRDGWAAAIAACMMQVRDQAVERAFNGHTAPILRYGRKVGERHVFDNRMLLSLMRLYDAPAYHAERARAEPASTLVPPEPLTQAQVVAQFEAALADMLRSAQAADIVTDKKLQPLAFDSPSKVFGMVKSRFCSS